MFWNYYYESNIQSADCRSNIRRILLMNYGKFSLAGVLVGVVTMLMRVVYSNCKFQFGIYRVYLKCLDKSHELVLHIKKETSSYKRVSENEQF